LTETGTGLCPLFLLSLPRTGSTLLQRMLSTHSKISTTDEVWILLPYLYSLRGNGLYAEYDHRVAVAGIKNFCKFLPGGREAYLKEIKQLALRIYRLASSPHSMYFLDKTPRYHLIVEEIISLFGDGRFVFLWRNPLAVVASMVDTGAGGRWWLHSHRVDLFTGLTGLVDAYCRHRERYFALRYEDLVAEPEAQMRGILGYLGLTWEPGLIHPIDQQPLFKWRRTLATPVRKRWCARYLRWIGSERLAIMGYNLGELLAQLSELPNRYSMLSDYYLTVKAAVWNVVEPTIAQEKLAKIPDCHRIERHS